MASDAGSRQTRRGGAFSSSVTVAFGQKFSRRIERAFMGETFTDEEVLGISSGQTGSAPAPEVFTDDEVFSASPVPGMTPAPMPPAPSAFTYDDSADWNTQPMTAAPIPEPMPVSPPIAINTAPP